METNKILFILMLFIFTANALFLLFKFKAESLSSEWYYLQKNYKYAFPIVTFIYSTLLIVIGLKFTDWSLCGLALYYVATAPEYKESGAKSISHFFGAAIAVIGSQIMIISLGYLWLTIAFLVLTLAAYMFDKKKVTYWAEIFAFYSVSLMLSFLIWK